MRGENPKNKNIAIIGTGSQGSIGWDLAERVKDSEKFDNIFIVNKTLKNAEKLKFKLKSLGEEHYCNVITGYDFNEIKNDVGLAVVCADISSYKQDIDNLIKACKRDIKNIEAVRKKNPKLLPNRDKWLKDNIPLIESLIPQFKRYTGHTIITTNPIDIVTQMFATYCNLPVEKITGFSHVDRARFIGNLKEFLNSEPAKIIPNFEKISIVGQHNETRVPLLSQIELNITETMAERFLTPRNEDDIKEFLQEYQKSDILSIFTTGNTSTDTVPYLFRHAKKLSELYTSSIHGSGYLEYEGFKGFTGGRVELQNLKAYYDTEILKMISNDEKIKFMDSLQRYNDTIERFIKDGYLDRKILTDFNTETLDEREEIAYVEPRREEPIIVSPSGRTVSSNRNIEDRLREELVKDLDVKIVVLSKNPEEYISDKTIKIYGLKNGLSPSPSLITLEFTENTDPEENEKNSINRIINCGNEIYISSLRKFSNKNIPTKHRISHIDIDSQELELGDTFELDGEDYLKIFTKEDKPYFISMEDRKGIINLYDSKNSSFEIIAKLNSLPNNIIGYEKGFIFSSKNNIYRFNETDETIDNLIKSDLDIGSTLLYDEKSDILFYNIKGNSNVVAYDIERDRKIILNAKLGTFNFFNNGKDIRIIRQNGNLIYSIFRNKDELFKENGQIINLNDAPRRIRDVKFIDDNKFIFNSIDNEFHIGIVQDENYIIEKIPYISNFDRNKGVVIR